MFKDSIEMPQTGYALCYIVCSGAEDHIDPWGQSSLNEKCVYREADPAAYHRRLLGGRQALVFPITCSFLISWQVFALLE